MNEDIFTIEIIVGMVLVFSDFFLLHTPGLQAAFFGTLIIFFSVIFGLTYLIYKSIEVKKK